MKICDECGALIQLGEDYYASCDDHICADCMMKKFPEKWQRTLMYYFGTDEPSYADIERVLERIIKLSTDNGYHKIIDYLEQMSCDNGGYYLTIHEDPDDIDFPDDCSSADCDCPCLEFCKDKMLGVDHFSCDEVWEKFKESQASEKDYLAEKEKCCPLTKEELLTR